MIGYRIDRVYSLSLFLIVLSRIVVLNRRSRSHSDVSIEHLNIYLRYQKSFVKSETLRGCLECKSIVDILFHGLGRLLMLIGESRGWPVVDFMSSAG
jgi:hypothetical protein